jgi:hypothetical protein
MKKCTPLWREAHFEVHFEFHFEAGMLKTPSMLSSRETAMARRTLRSHNVQNTSAPEPFWILSYGKSAPPWWREAHLEIRNCKTHHVRITFLKFELVKKCAQRWRETHFQPKC